MDAHAGGRACCCNHPLLLLRQYWCVLGVVVVPLSPTGLGLATKIRGAFRSLHQLNGSVISAGMKEVQSEVRNGAMVFGGSDALG